MCLCPMETSSIMSNFVYKGSFPVTSLFEKLQNEFSFSFIGTLSLECTVDPFTSRFEPTALIAVARATYIAITLNSMQ